MFQKRIANLRELFLSTQIDGLLVTNPINIRWLSGFTGSYGHLLVTAEKVTLATDSRYWIQARLEAPDVELFADNRDSKSLVAFLAPYESCRLGFESDYVTWEFGTELQNFKNITWVPVSQLVSSLRQRKYPEEITAIKMAASITDRAMDSVPTIVKTGITEIELAWQIEKTMREDGASGVAFPLIVAFGSNSALPHHDPSDRKLKVGEIVLVDIGAEMNGYKSDMTRTFYYGPNNDEFNKIFDIVLAAQANALAGIWAGSNSCDPHNLAMDVIAQAGYGDKFSHGLGHGVGLDIHEQPMLSFRREPVSLEPGMVITIEPGIYIEGWGGIRIEDLVVVTDEGFEYLSFSPKSRTIHPKFTTNNT